MVLFVRTNSIVSDSRLNRYIAYLEKENIPYHILGWDRVGENPSIKNVTFFKKRSGYNVGGWRAVWYRIQWTIFAFKFFLSGKFHVIHGCDLDAVFPAVLYKIIVNKKCRIIFDVFDWFSDTLSNQGGVIKMAFSQMERLSVKYVDEIILCEAERERQIPYRFHKQYLVLPNIPYFNQQMRLERRSDMTFDNSNITLSYVGGFYEERFLDELVGLAKEGHVNLLVGGYGSKEIETLFLEIADRDNVKYFGKVNYDLGLNIMYNSDLIYAMYCKTNPNHIYAAPNKYYEAMFLGKAILSTEGTLVGDKVQSNEMGYVISESYISLIDAIYNIDKSQLLKKGFKSKELWVEYSGYTETFMKKIYRPIIEKV